jgi:hypothetical protein
MRASAWRPHSSGSLQGFFNLRLASGLRINDMTLHQKGASRWCGLPAKPLLDSDGRHKVGDNGKKAYVKILDFVDRDVRDQFTAEALAAVDRMLGR